MHEFRDVELDRGVTGDIAADDAPVHPYRGSEHRLLDRNAMEFGQMLLRDGEGRAMPVIVMRLPFAGGFSEIDKSWHGKSVAPLRRLCRSAGLILPDAVEGDGAVEVLHEL